MKLRNITQHNNHHMPTFQTSGVMVFARTFHAASALSKAWRERDQVSKIYLAKVHTWPPLLQQQKQQPLTIDSSTSPQETAANTTTITEGVIDIPLEPSEERVKWQVATDPNSSTAKPSKTLWKVMPNSSFHNNDVDGGHVVLRLQPITGRTHQLRIHCAHVGSGIVGDSLYGRDAATTNDTKEHAKHKTDYLPDITTRLYLHAYQLSFPHPTTGNICEYTSAPNWL